MAVLRLEIRSREPYEDGKSFADAGAYERLDGTLHFAVDPVHAANGAIVDLDLAPRDSQGRVHFSADFALLQPADPARGNRRLLLDVLNRGNKLASRLNRGAPPTAPSDRFDPGDGFLLRRGWTVAWCGWQWDVVSGPGAMGLAAPQALGADGQPLQGDVAIQFQPDQRIDQRQLGHSIGLSQAQPYPAVDIAQPDAVLTVREAPNAAPSTIPRPRWRFARAVDGRVAPDDSFIWLAGGFEAGKVYEVTYRTRVCPVVGAGLLATRDAAAFLRRGGVGAGNPCAGRIDYGYAYGVSQTGRFLRHFLYLGLNLDEAGEQVFDGVLAEIAGARRGEFNNRYGQPSVAERPGFSFQPPFLAQGTGKESGAPGLLDRQRALGGVPKVILTNTAAEYWGVANCALIHSDGRGEGDVEPPADVRLYSFAGTQHGYGALQFLHGMPGFTPACNLRNVVDYSPLTRAALVNLDRWASAQAEPPPSAFPRLAEGSAIRREAALATFRALPGVALPDPALLPATWLPEPNGAPYPLFVSAVDADGNEIAGIRLPELTQPVATYTGWNPRQAEIGGAGQLVGLAGSTVPFPATAASRRGSGDPRPAIEERYRDRDDYAARVRADTARLASQGYILEEDVELAVRNALHRYDTFAAPVAAAAERR